MTQPLLKQAGPQSHENKHQTNAMDKNTLSLSVAGHSHGTRPEKFGFLMANPLKYYLICKKSRKDSQVA